MSDKIKELEKALREAKKEELTKKWDIYLNDCKKFLDSIKGKTILRWYSNGGCVIFRVKDYTEQYYIDRDGMNGQWSNRRWYELITDSYFTCRVCDNKGNYYHPSILSLPLNYNFIFEKSKQVKVSQIKCGTDLSREVSSDVKQLTRFGYSEYQDSKDDPSYDRTLTDFVVFAYVIPNEILDDALIIHNDHANKTKMFWEKYKQVVSDSPKLSSFFDKKYT
jgi:hypothetical protein